MKQKSKLIEVLHELVDADNQNDFSMVTYRTTQKTATMLEVMSIVLKKPMSNLLTTLISEKIVEVILSDQKNMELLKEFFETKHRNSGFIKILEENQVIEKKIEFSEFNLG